MVHEEQTNEEIRDLRDQINFSVRVLRSLTPEPSEAAHVGEEVSEHLFDPAPYGGTPRELRSRQPRPLNMIDNDGRWFLIRGLKGLHPGAHLLKVYEPDNYGAVYALCGVHGSRVDVMLLDQVANACPNCAAERAKGKKYHIPEGRRR